MRKRRQTTNGNAGQLTREFIRFIVHITPLLNGLTPLYYLIIKNNTIYKHINEARVQAFFPRKKTLS
jgi:hypothetical protein